MKKDPRRYELGRCFSYSFSAETVHTAHLGGCYECRARFDGVKRSLTK